MRTALTRVPRWLPGLILGAGAGVPLGLRIGYCRGFPLFGSDSDLAVQGILLTGLVAGVVVILLLWAVARRSGNPLLAAGALVASVLAASMVAPSAPGSPQSSNGTGSAGTPGDATAYWSGSVTCRWNKGDMAVDSVAGFNMVVSDPALLAELGLDAAALNLGPSVTVVAITLPRGLQGSAGLGVGEDRDHYTGTGAMLRYEDGTADGRAARAVSPHGSIVFAWSCSKGPS